MGILQRAGSIGRAREPYATAATEWKNVQSGERRKRDIALSQRVTLHLQTFL